MTLRMGLIINPIAGMGGSVGLKGTDGDLAAKAQAMGAVPVAEPRAMAALAQLADLSKELLVVTCSGQMGALAVEQSGLQSCIVSKIESDKTTARDTRTAAAAILAHQPVLLLFAGGDGTARDLLPMVEQGVPILGIPSGVKMHSAVFAASARAAGEVARRYLLANDRESLLEDAEIMDRASSVAGETSLSPKLFGIVRTPHLAFLVPGAKSSSRVTETAALAGAIRRACDFVRDERISLIGSGSTMQMLKRQLGLEGTQLGVDAVQNGTCVAEDVNERDILELIRDRPARIVVSVVGGQGFLFGRGNQQLSARVIRAVGTDNIVVVSSLEKLTALSGKCLLIDTGDEDLDANLSGYVKVIVSSARTVMMPVRHASDEGLE